MANKWTLSLLMTNNSYEIMHYRNKDFQKVSLHSHDFFELYFFISGSVSYIIENGHYTLKSGDILLIPPNTLHQLDINDSKETYERIVLWINPKYIAKLSSAQTHLAISFENCKNGKNYLIRDDMLCPEIKFALFALYNCSKEYGADIFAEIQIKSILLSLAKYSVNPNNKAVTSYTKKPNPLIKKTVDYIDNNLDKPLSLDNLSEMAFVNKYHLSRLFKKETNTTLHQYILKKRLVLSKQLIEQNYPIIELYSKCGFSDYSHFFRAFKQEFGITPKKYLALTKRL